LSIWHLLTPEFPPGGGGVGDYTAILAAGLAGAGDSVHVWYPAPGMPQPGAAVSPGVVAHHLPDRFGPGSRAMLRTALSAAPGIVVAQYVPAAFGARGMNVAFCRWLARLRRDGTDVRVMFHEPFFYFGISRPWRNALAVVQRAMAAILLRAGTRIYYSTETWRRLLAPYGPQAAVEILPIPATIPVEVPAEAVSEARAALKDARRGGAFLIGHFGTYGDHVGRELDLILPALLRRLPGARVLLVGEGSETFARRLPSDLRERVESTGRLPGAAAAAALRACDLLVQPYPDGVTTRRTSVMAALTTSVPVLTTSGPLTEPVWAQSSGVALTGDVRALVEKAAALEADPASRAALGARGRDLYDRQFALDVTIGRMRR
jgi:glycosyltransferase involved in cell wall biosynthesis